MQNCERCKHDAIALSGSYFNTQMICPVCTQEERKHPLFQHAKDVELEECLKGNLNYEGIGLPDDLKAKYDHQPT
jgi:hypothetical protein